MIVISVSSFQADVNANCMTLRCFRKGFFYDYYCSDESLNDLFTILRLWYIGCVFDVVLGGRKTGSIVFKPSTDGCAVQLSTIRTTYGFLFKKLCLAPFPFIEKEAVYPTFFCCDRYWQARLAIFLKHLGLADFPITDIGNFSPNASADVIQVIRTLLFTTLAFLPFRCKFFGGSPWQNNPNSSASYLSL